MELELGLDTFGDVTVDASGVPPSDAEVLRNVVAEGVLADQVGIDFIGVGETTTVPTLRSRRPRSCSRRSRARRIGSGSARR